MSVMSRVQMTPLKDMDRYMAGASLIRNDIGIEQVLVQETNSLVGGGEREGALVHHPHTLTELSAIETGQHRRLSAHSCRTSKSSQSSRTTAGEREYFDWEGNLNLKSNVQNNVKDDADDVDDFEEYGQSAFSIVEYEEAGAALSAESETSTGEAGRGSLVAQASMEFIRFTWNELNSSYKKKRPRDSRNKWKFLEGTFATQQQLIELFRKDAFLRLLKTTTTAALAPLLACLCSTACSFACLVP
ncbi:hypothetical protein BDR26DRAFT_707129 [Obelidium mucronatum]|nr:hypothetical protein BDR26DRAFT_707129 [Obelidium mucronatum]